MNRHPVRDHPVNPNGASVDHLAHLRQLDIDNRTRAMRRAARDERVARRAAQFRHAERVHGASVPRPNALRVRLGQALVAAGQALAQDAVEETAS